MLIEVRELTSNDIEACVRLFHDTVHAINSKDYTLDQLQIWAPENIDAHGERWQSLLHNISLVAEVNSKLVGFIDTTYSGYLDRLYVHKDYQGKGIASNLLHNLEMIAREHSIAELLTDASITAKPFFELNGFTVCKEQNKLFGGMHFINYLMRKKLI